MDVGGTFTDSILLDRGSGRWFVDKRRTSAPDQAQACLHALEAVIARARLEFEDVTHLAHGTTVATNALVERRGARTALITTRGFRDVLDIRRQVMPHRYDPSVAKPAPLVERALRSEVSERTLSSGEVEQAVDTDELTAALEGLKDAGIEAIAIAFLHSYANSENEEVAAQLARSAGDWVVVASHEVLNEPREYERTSTVIANAYLSPAMARYLTRLAAGTERLGVRTPPLVFQSNGGLVSAEAASELPVTCLYSGPAAGVIAATSVARSAESKHFISFDMGGTSADVALVDDFSPSLAEEQEVGGWPIRSPRLDIHSVGAGGGSIAWVDEGGLLRVGPQSAGSTPGPACYASGGTRPTVSDAHVVLNRLSDGHPLAGGLELDADAAWTVMTELGSELGTTAEEAARRVLAIVNATMVSAIRVISIEHGHDPRKYAMIAFGGAGPLHACDLVRMLGLSMAVIPPRPGLLCAAGLLSAGLRVDARRVIRARLSDEDAELITQRLGDLDEELRASTAVASHRDIEWHPSYGIRIRYVGQSFDLEVPVAVSELAPFDIGAIGTRFHDVHTAAYGHATPGAPMEIVGLRLSLHSESDNGLVVETTEPEEPTSSHERPVYFDGYGWMQGCPIYSRAELVPGQSLEGPGIIEQLDATIVVDPRFTGCVDRSGNVILTRRAAP